MRWGRISSTLGVAALTILLVSGCGGSETVYEPSTVRDCLDKVGTVGATRSGETWDGFDASVYGATVTLAFGGTSDDAAQLRDFLTEGQVPAGDTVSTRGNAVVLWESTPTDEQRDALNGCLS